jgi:hypothetical protein
MPKLQNHSLKISYTLEELFKKRTGGSINFRGINFQVIYSCLLLMEHLTDPQSQASVRLEGIEDADLLNSKLRVGNDYIQLKSSENRINAGDFWSMKVLQNFLELHLVDPEATFRLVYNFTTSDGALKGLVDGELQAATLTHWHKKINEITDEKFDRTAFLKKICFERQNITGLKQSLTGQLYKKWNVNRGTEQQYINALAYHVLCWSEQRKTVSYQDIAHLRASINDAFSKATVNDAVKNDWIESVRYEPAQFNTEDHYYDGKAAQPYHIASELPAKRKYWEKELNDNLKATDVIVIRSSSGQGKSTLAWQMGHNLAGRHNTYRVNELRQWEQAQSIADFLTTRVAIGQYPLVIIDGLSSHLAKWAALVERTAQLPVKYIITTRYEDWIRYGADISKVALRHIDISLNEKEAADIYQQFRAKGRLHPEIKEWQPVWEQVSKRGLLIEYTYLLTRGQMIHERLDSQIKNLNNRFGAAAKVEILRMVSLADTLNIRLRTTHLLRYIAESIGFTQDRGETMADLQHEYFLNFENTYIEGLHPVRSQHIRNILHRALPLSESLVNLFPILEDTDTEAFFVSAPSLLEGQDRICFYRDIAAFLKDQSYTTIVRALDGVAYGEPQKYWLQNQSIYDKAFQRGGIVLFALNTVPGLGLNTFDELIRNVPSIGKNLTPYVEMLKELPPYQAEQTDVYLFALMLQQSLRAKRTSVSSYIGLADVAKWFGKLQLDIAFLHDFEGDWLSKSLPTMPLDEAIGIIQFYRIFHAGSYEKFVRTNKYTIFNYLRKATNSLIIQEHGKEIIIEYLIDGLEGLSPNELSVQRIETVFSFLPIYKKYNTKARMLPYPSPEIIAHSLNDAQKAMSPKNITDGFEARYNRIWTYTIEKNYECTSAYQWQKNYHYIRTTAIAWATNLLTVIDAIFEGNPSKRDKAVATFDSNRDELDSAINPEHPYPGYGTKKIGETQLKISEKEIKNWITALNNANNQVVSLFAPKGDNDQNVASINFKGIYFHLTKMQKAFHEMEQLTVAYFDFDVLDKKEVTVYTRLYKSVVYLVNHLPIAEQPKVQVAKKAIEQWWEGHQYQRIQALSALLAEASDVTGVRFTAPKHFIETETLVTVPIAMHDADFNDPETATGILAALATLGTFPATFFTLINISGNTIVSAVRGSRDFFSAVERYITTGDDAHLKGEQIYPVEPTEIERDCFVGFDLNPLKADVATQECVKIINSLWKLSQAKILLNKNNNFDASWLELLTNQTRAEIESLEKNGSANDKAFFLWAYKDINEEIKPPDFYLSKLFEIVRAS